MYAVILDNSSILDLTQPWRVTHEVFWTWRTMHNSSSKFSYQNYFIQTDAIKIRYIMCSCCWNTYSQYDVMELNIFRVTGPLWVGWIPSQKPVTRSFDAFIDLCLNNRLSKQSIPSMRFNWNQCLWHNLLTWIPGCLWLLAFVLNNTLILGIWCSTIPHLPGCFCPWTFF